jgi:hypothetical protein
VTSFPSFLARAAQEYYKGNYDTFEQVRAERRKQQERALESNEMRRAHIQVRRRRRGVAFPCVFPLVRSWWRAQEFVLSSCTAPLLLLAELHRPLPLQRQARVARPVTHQGAGAHGGAAFRARLLAPGIGTVGAGERRKERRPCDGRASESAHAGVLIR